jgi:hypothetical protein
LHLETEPAFQCALNLREQSSLIHQQAQSLVVLARSMEWLGLSRDVFQEELEQVAISLDQIAEQGSFLSNQVIKVIDQWYGLDQVFVEYYSKIGLDIGLD